MYYSYIVRLISKVGINRRVTKDPPSLLVRSHPFIHTWNKKRKMTIPNMIFCQLHSMYTCRNTITSIPHIKPLCSAEKKSTNWGPYQLLPAMYVDSYNPHRTLKSNKLTTPANHGESIVSTLVAMSGIIQLGECVRMVRCMLLWEWGKVYLSSPCWW